jgi:hypothetical protein
MRVNGFCVAVPAANDNIGNVTLAIAEVLKDKEFRAHHDQASAEYVFRLKSDKQVRLLTEVGLMLQKGQTTVRDFKGPTPIPIRITGVDVMASEEEVMEALRRELGPHAKVWGGRLVKKRLGDSVTLIVETMHCKIIAPPTDIPKSIIVKGLFMRISRSDTCWRCHMIGHMERDCVRGRGSGPVATPVAAPVVAPTVTPVVNPAATPVEVHSMEGTGEEASTETESDNEGSRTPTQSRARKPAGGGEQGVGSSYRRNSTEYVELNPAILVAAMVSAEQTQRALDAIQPDDIASDLDEDSDQEEGEVQAAASADEEEENDMWVDSEDAAMAEEAEEETIMTEADEGEASVAEPEGEQANNASSGADTAKKAKKNQDTRAAKVGSQRVLRRSGRLQGQTPEFESN